jgi:zinc and cadmium transporter
VHPLFWILFCSVIGNIGTVVLASSMLFLHERALKRFVAVSLNYATGTLLGAAFIGMLPRSFQILQPAEGLQVALAGLFGFYLLERFLVWRHCHREKCERHAVTGPLILLGDGFHNFADGVIIAAMFLQSVEFGIATAIAVIVHEIPQELGDLAILLSSGYGKAQAFLYNALSGASAVAGGLAGYFLLRSASLATPYVLCVSASSFIYIALADLIPEQRGETDSSSWWREAALVMAGIATIMVIKGVM